MKQYNIERFSNGFLVECSQPWVMLGGGSGSGGGSERREGYFFADTATLGHWLAADLDGTYHGVPTVYISMNSAGGAGGSAIHCKIGGKDYVSYDGGGMYKRCVDDNG